MNIPKNLVNEIARGNCVLFLGSGLSMVAGLPNWPQLLERMLCWSKGHEVDMSHRAEIEHSISNEKYLLAAEVIVEQIGVEKFRRFMTEVFRKPGMQPTDAHLILPQIPFAGILTTNYDNLAESGYAVSRRGELPPVFTQMDVAELSAALRAGEFYILKAHGTIDRIETVVLTKCQYRALMHTNPAYRQFLSSLFSTKTMLFIGFGLTDPDLLMTLDEMQAAFAGYTGTHYALVDSNRVTSIERQRYMKDYGIEILTYNPSGPEHPEVKDFLKSLAAAAPGKAVQHMMSQARKFLDDADPHYRIVANTKGQFSVEAKHPGAFEEHPLTGFLKVQFTETDEGRTAREDFERNWTTRKPVRISSKYIKEYKLPELLMPYIGPADGNYEIEFGPAVFSKPLLVKIIFKADDGEEAVFDYIHFEAEGGDEETTFTNEKQPVPWKFKITVNFPRKWIEVSYTLRARDFNVKQAFQAYRFMYLMSRGGVFCLEMLETGLLYPIADIPAQDKPRYGPLWIELLEKLNFIQNKTQTPITLHMGDTITPDMAEIIFSTAHIIETGQAISEMHQIEMTIEMEKAKDVLDQFKDGKTIPTTFKLKSEQTITILGVDIPLGPVSYTCDKVYLASEDIESLRAAIENHTGDSSIPVRLSIEGGCQLQAWYSKWLPSEQSNIES